MEHNTHTHTNRYCKACNNRASEDAQAKHPYLKRRSVSSIKSKKSTKSANSSKRNSFVDLATIEADQTFSSNPDPASAMPVTADLKTAADDAELDQRIENAEQRLSLLLLEARKDLTGSRAGSVQQSADESTDENDASQWAKHYEKTEQQIEVVQQENEKLLQEVNDAADDLAATDLASPSTDSSASEPLLTPPTETSPPPTVESEPQVVRKRNLGMPPVEVPLFGEEAAPASQASGAKKTKRKVISKPEDGWRTLWRFDLNKKW